MKVFSITLPMALLGLAPKVSALFQLEMVYSDQMVPISDVDLFHTVWEILYEQSGEFGGLSDRTYQAHRSECVSWADKPDLDVNVKLDGQWGDVGNVSSWTMRDALVETAWKAVDELSKPTAYDIYTNCYGLTWQEGVPNDPQAPCGRKDTPDCPCENGSAQCSNHTRGHQIPSKIKIQTYDDGVLFPVNYELDFSSALNAEAGGCGRYGAIAEVFASFIPGVGTFFEKGIKVACRQ